MERNQQLMVLLHQMGEKYGTRPSTWLKSSANARSSPSTPDEADDVSVLFDLEFDAACFMIGSDYERRVTDSLRHKR